LAHTKPEQVQVNVDHEGLTLEIVVRKRANNLGNWTQADEQNILLRDWIARHLEEENSMGVLSAIWNKCRP